MESSNASSWLMNFEVNYSSFFQDFAQFDGLVSSPMIPEFSTPSPGDCLSNSSSNLDQSPQIDTPPPASASESTLPNVDNDQGKKKRRPRNNGGNSRSAKGKKATDKEASKDLVCPQSTDNSNQSEKGGRGRKRTYEETVEGNSKNSSNNSPVDPEPQLELHNRKHHVIAERKRREKLTQRFIALSSLVPGLTRMDKASVLADAIRYVKQLQERVQTLETEAAQKNAQATVVIKKSQSTSPDECNSSTTCGDNTPVDELSTKAAGPPPEIEVRISEQRVLIKIHCEGQKGVLVKALSEIESLGLAIVSTTVVPFTSSSLDITITAKVNEELSLTVEDLVKRLNFVLNNCNSFP